MVLCLRGRCGLLDGQTKCIEDRVPNVCLRAGLQERHRAPPYGAALVRLLFLWSYLMGKPEATIRRSMVIIHVCEQEWTSIKDAMTGQSIYGRGRTPFVHRGLSNRHKCTVVVDA